MVSDWIRFPYSNKLGQPMYGRPRHTLATGLEMEKIEARTVQLNYKQLVGLKPNFYFRRGVEKGQPIHGFLLVNRAI